jgi:hypothetical protein
MIPATLADRAKCLSLLVKVMPDAAPKQALGRIFGWKAVLFHFSTKRLLGSVLFIFSPVTEPCQ